jgi:outer membrane protein insertion porin family
LTFGAGYSQFDGVFGQVAFQTSNFMGRGETLGVSVQHGEWSQNAQISFTRPYNFARPISLGTQVYRRRINWIGSFAENTVGGTTTFGIPLALFTRLFLTYSLDSTTASISEYFAGNLQQNPAFFAYNPFLADALLLGSDGRRVVSKITPQFRLNTVDHPIFPSQGRSLSLAIELAGAGGNTKFLKPILEATWYKPHTARTIVGFRVQYRHLQSSSPQQIPVFERLWLGGEYSIRGFDIRRIGPTLSETNPEVTRDSYQGFIVLGGNKSVLFNAEYQFVLGGAVRLVAFYDAGQVQDFGQKFTSKDFKTSTGLELRFFMPMLNVPFRLIYYWNPQHDGIFNDQFREQEPHGFRFAMGTTF